jgi:FtsH-like protein
MTRTNGMEAARRPAWWRTSKIWWLIAILAVLTLLIVVVMAKAGGPAPLPYSTFLDQLEAGNVASVTFQGTAINGRFNHPLDSTHPDTFSSRVPDFGDATLIPELRRQHVVINVTSSWDWTSLLTHLPWPMVLVLGVAVVAGLVGLLRGGKTPSGSMTGMHPMQAIMAPVMGLFAKPMPGASRPEDDSAVRPIPPARPGAATVDVIYMNHPPVRPVVSEIDQLLATYGDRLSVTHYEFNQPDGQAFARAKGLTGHTPMAIFVNGSMESTAGGHTVRYYRFPKGRGPGMMPDGDWTLEDLRLALDAVAAVPA